jgi:hypothetical protein
VLGEVAFGWAFPDDEVVVEEVSVFAVTMRSRDRAAWGGRSAAM